MMSNRRGGRSSESRARRRAIMFEQQGGVCFWCRIPMSLRKPDSSEQMPAPNYATFDELLPRLRGGTLQWSNTVLACWTCNFRRGTKIATQADRDRLKAMRDAWASKETVVQ